MALPAIPAGPMPPGPIPLELNELSRVELHASQALVDRVAAWETANAALAWLAQPSKQAAPLPALGDYCTVTALSVLNELGNATIPIGVDTPFLHASWWARVRYFWAFQVLGNTPPRRLALSDPAASLTHRHKGTLAEDLGIGFAIEVLRQHLAGVHPAGSTIDFIDADVALGAGIVGGFPVAQTGAFRPDYFVHVAEPAGIQQIYALEVKGIGSLGKDRDRVLARGLRQIRSVTSQGAVPAGFVSATTATDTRITLALLDPEGDPAWRGESTRSDEPVVRRRGSEWEITDLDGFRSVMEDLSDAKLLSWAGADESAAKCLAPWMQRQRPADSRPRTDRPSVDASISGRAYRGVEARVPFGDRTLRVFRGLDSTLAEALIRRSADSQPGQAIRSEVRTARQEIAREIRSVNGDEVVSINRNGTALHLTLT
jgi:hypothetical protein